MSTSWIVKHGGEEHGTCSACVESDPEVAAVAEEGLLPGVCHICELEDPEALEVELAQIVHGIIGKAIRGELSKAYLASGRELVGGEPNDQQLAAAAIVEMCRQAFSGEWVCLGCAGGSICHTCGKEPRA